MKKLSKITEGILGDIARRDLSGGTKKEDSIDNMSFTDFYYYVLDHYEVKNNQFEITLSKRYDDMLIITFPVIKFKLKTMTGTADKESYIEMVFTDDEKRFANISKNVLSYCPDFEAGIGNDYECDDKGTIMIKIHPKNNKLDNRTRLELMDKVIEVLGDDCILKKK